MIPIKDSGSADSKKTVTISLIIINILVFLYMYSLPDAEFNQFIEKYAVIPYYIIHGKNLISLITSMFLHGGIMHIVGNMIFLYIFGDNIEHRLGSVKFLLFYLFSGIVGSIAQILISPFSTIPMLGASGAISGILGAYLVLFPNNRIKVLVSSYYGLRVATLPASTMLLYWIFYQFIYSLDSFTYMGQDVGGVAYLAHIGGFLFGVFIAKSFKDSILYYEDT